MRAEYQDGFVIVIRRFQPLDFQQVMEIEEEAFSEHNPYFYMQFYELNADTFLVAERGGNVLGFAVGLQVSGLGKVFSISVRKGYRGMGIGGMLLESLIRIFHNMGLAGVALEVRDSNYRARLFYEKHGFVRVGLCQNYYSDGENALLMRRVL